MNYETVANRADLAQRAANIVEGFVTERARSVIGLAGGSTPPATHEELARRSIDWSAVTAWIPDERWVPPDHQDANQRMARETLTEDAGIDLLAPDTTMATPEACAASYGERILPLLGDPAVSSLTMLGMGTDGHTASLFPGTAALHDRRVAYVANDVPQLDTHRLTATFPMLALSTMVLFLVAGEDKAAMVRAIAEGADLPAGRVTARDGVLWLLDAGAASEL